MSRWRTGPTDDFPARDTPWPLGWPAATKESEPDDAGVRSRQDIPPDPPGLMTRRQPETQIQALMEAAPHTEPAESIEEQLALMEVLGDAIERMPDHLRWAFEAVVHRGLSYQLGADEISISKSTFRYRYHKAVQWLQDELKDHPIIAARLETRNPNG